MLYFYYGDDMKKGFTLVELLGVLVVLVILSLLITVMYTALKKDADKTIDEALTVVINDASVTYVKKYKTSIKENNVYCISLNDLLNNNLLSSPVKNSSGEVINPSLKIKVVVKKDRYDVTVDTKECIEFVH